MIYTQKNKIQMADEATLSIVKRSEGGDKNKVWGFGVARRSLRFGRDDTEGRKVGMASG